MCLSEYFSEFVAQGLELPEVAGRPLTDFAPSSSQRASEGDGSLSAIDLDDLFRRQSAGELTAQEMLSEMQGLRERRTQERQSSSTSNILQALTERSGVNKASWSQAGYELLDVILPVARGPAKRLSSELDLSAGAEIARGLGISEVLLVSDFPVVTAAYPCVSIMGWTPTADNSMSGGRRPV